MFSVTVRENKGTGATYPLAFKRIVNRDVILPDRPLAETLYGDRDKAIPRKKPFKIFGIKIA